MKRFLLFFSLYCVTWAGALHWQRSFLETPKLDTSGLRVKATYILMGISAQMELVTGVLLMRAILFGGENDEVVLRKAKLVSHIMMKAIVAVHFLVFALGLPWNAAESTHLYLCFICFNMFAFFSFYLFDRN